MFFNYTYNLKKYSYVFKYKRTLFMKKFIIVFGILMISIISYSQDTIRVVHKNYTSVFSVSKHYPVLVEWWDTKDKVTLYSHILQ